MKKNIKKIVLSLSMLLGISICSADMVFANSKVRIVEKENNNTIDIANILGVNEIMEGRINGYSDKDYFKFRAKETQKMALRFSRGSVDWTNGYLSDKDMNVGLFYNIIDVTTGEKIIGDKFDENANEYRHNYLTFDAKYNHTYVVEVINVPSNEYRGATYSLYLTPVTRSYELEYNDFIDEANYIELNRTIGGKVDGEDDREDWFSFIATSDWTIIPVTTGNNEKSLEAKYYIEVRDNTTGLFEEVTSFNIEGHRNEPGSVGLSFRTIPGHVYSLSISVSNLNRYAGATYSFKVMAGE